MLSWFFKDEAGTAADLYVDLGTANTLIAARGKGIILNEPSLIAYQQTSPGKKRVIAVGTDAKEKLANNPGSIFPQKPIRDGVIADFDTTEVMLRHFLSQPGVKSAYSRPRVVVSLPYGVTEVEKKAVIQSCKAAGAKEVYLIDEPMAAAIGSGLNIKSAEGSMIIDIGGGTTEVAVIALADIVYCEAARVGGHRIDDAIIDYFRRYKKIIISESTAEHLKVTIGTAVPKKDIRTETITGRDAETGMNKNMEVSSEDVGLAMNGNIQEVINAIHKALEHTPPELVSDIIENGVVLAGGGALIRDFDLRIQNEVRLPVRVAENPLTAIAKGGEAVLSDPELLDKIQLEV
ncbi:rod shape-determining protein [Bdellovibrio bacteriovorus]|uniref:Cell shape-determining protein MreB n=1 Tax=Bdellovibrio bacteriovorus TaxID=959 RepID=A0A150WL87_BDEBC|nr:rod shape-determining protein [Bdellovibrio bacteriovorus]KYG64666.1 rod shape-determining protein [Bdellovibrio bacteriovorus]